MRPWCGLTIAAIVLVVSGAGSAAGVARGGVREAAAVRVLFIGNSLTYLNDLPAMVEALARQSKIAPRVTCRMVAFPDASLEDHWTKGDALRLLRSESWTHVVLQQGPSSLPASQASLREWTRRFAGEARARGAAVVLYGVWPPKERLGFQEAVTEAYRRAADDAGGSLVAVGDAWRAAWALDPSLPLYERDDFHPSARGTYLAALMFLAHLTGQSPIGLPNPGESRDAALRRVQVSAAQLAALQQAAVFAGTPARSPEAPR